MVIPEVDFGLKDIRAHILRRQSQIICQCDLWLFSGPTYPAGNLAHMVHLHLFDLFRFKIKLMKSMQKHAYLVQQRASDRYMEKESNKNQRLTHNNLK